VGREKCRFWTFKPTYLWNSVRYGPSYYWSLIGICIRAFDCIKIDDLGWSLRAIIDSVTLCTCLSEAITKIWMKIDPYYQRHKYSAETVRCEDIKVMPIFVGVRWIWGSKWEWGRRKLPFFASCGRYIFPKFIYETKIIKSEYVVLQWLFIDIETDDLEWPWIAILR